MMKRDRRALVLGLIVISAAFLALRGLPAWRGWVSESRAVAEELSVEVARAQMQSSFGSSMLDTLEARNRRFLALEPLLVDGSTAASATASLTGLVTVAATTSNVHLGTLQVTADSSPSRNFARITVRGQANGDVRGLTAMIARLEGGTTLLRLSELQVTQMDPAAPSDRGESLQMSFTVHGLALLRESKSR